MYKEINTTLKKAPKRFSYDVSANVDVHGKNFPVQIHNISKSGIQFYSNVSITSQSPIKLCWKDLKLGMIESQLSVVRSIEQPPGAIFKFCYGSKFVNLKEEVRKNVNRLIETTEEHERKLQERTLGGMPAKTINDVITHGRVFLRDTLKGNKAAGVIDEFTKELKDYEKQSFDETDEVSQWIQKIVTQYFHSRILLVVLSSSVTVNGSHKLITDKLESMNCLIIECQKFVQTKGITKSNKLHKGLLESLNRLVYGRLELVEKLNKRTISMLGARRL